MSTSVVMQGDFVVLTDMPWKAITREEALRIAAEIIRVAGPETVTCPCCRGRGLVTAGWCYDCDGTGRVQEGRSNEP